MSEHKNLNDEFVTSDTVDQPKEEEPVTENDPIREEGEATAERQTPPGSDFGNFHESNGTATAYTITTDAPQNEASHKQDIKNAEVTALVLGIISIPTITCCFINIVLGIIAICFAFKTRKLSPDHKMSSMALGGMICACISLGFTVLFMMAFIFMILFTYLLAWASAFHFNAYESYEVASFIMSLF